MKYNIIMKIPSEKEGTYNENKILDFVKGLGWNLVKVNGRHNAWWFTSKTDYVAGMTRAGLVDGPRYYKLVINSREFGIECGGDYNGWSFAEELRSEIKKQREAA